LHLRTRLIINGSGITLFAGSPSSSVSTPTESISTFPSDVLMRSRTGSPTGTVAVASAPPNAQLGATAVPAGLRISVVGGGCSGFTYSMAFENTPNMLNKTYQFNGLKVFIDQASMFYLDGAEVDYVETLEGSGFKFNNPNVKSTCGCGSSFNA
jgi:iron-sulfur cluster assembly protein